LAEPRNKKNYEERVTKRNEKEITLFRLFPVHKQMRESLKYTSFASPAE